MNTQINQWINNFYRHGAIGIDERDDFKTRLNVHLDDFEVIVRDMDAYAKFMPARWQPKWDALKNEFPHLRLEMERAALYAIKEPTQEQWKRLHDLDLKLGY